MRRALVVLLVLAGLALPAAWADPAPGNPENWADLTLVSLSGNVAVIHVDILYDDLGTRLLIRNTCSDDGVQGKQVTADGDVTFTNAAGHCQADALWKGKNLTHNVGSLFYEA